MKAGTISEIARQTFAKEGPVIDPDLVPEISPELVLQGEHRDKESGFLKSHLAAVARKVPRSEWSKPKATEALDGEWEKLRTMPWPGKHPEYGHGKGTWDESRVEEAAKVRARAARDGETVHFARLCELLYEKNSELAEDDPLRIFKGRSVVLGNQMKDQHFDYAMFQAVSYTHLTLPTKRIL